MGNRLDLYDTITWFDDWMHFMNNALLGAAAVAFVMTVSLAWERFVYMPSPIKFRHPGLTWVVEARAPGRSGSVLLFAGTESPAHSGPKTLISTGRPGWDGPMETLTNHEIRNLVELACRAPSVHNTQPWRWVYRDGVLTLNADTTRQLMYTDRNRRDLVVSCGAALHHLEVAARGTGWSPSVTRLPEPADESWLATVTFGTYAPDQGEVLLARAIPDRRTDRRQVSSWPVPAPRIDGLRDLASRLGVRVTSLDAGVQDKLMALLSTATHAQNAQDRYLDELLAWTDDRVSGVPTTSLLTRAAAARAPGAFTRFPAGSLEDDCQGDAPPEAEWLLLSTSSDDPLSWLRTGEALSSIWLTCTVVGLALVPYTQVVQVERTRAALQADLLDDTSCPQALLRIGWPAAFQTPVPPTSRRPLSEVLDHPEMTERKEER